MTDPAFPAAPFAHGERISLDPTPLAVVRHEGIRLDALPAFFDADYRAVALLFGTGALIPAGPALALYTGDVSDTFDIEIGFPVVEALGEPEVVAGLTVIGSRLPSGPAVASTLFGAYEELPLAWQALVRAAAPATAAKTWVEVYVSDPTEPPERLRTDLLMPIEA